MPATRILAVCTANISCSPRARTGGDDVPDPYGRGPAAYLLSLSLIAEATNMITRLVGG